MPFRSEFAMHRWGCTHQLPVALLAMPNASQSPCQMVADNTIRELWGVTGASLGSVAFHPVGDLRPAACIDHSEAPSTMGTVIWRPSRMIDTCN